MEVFCQMGGKFGKVESSEILAGLTASYMAAEREWNGVTEVPEELKNHPTTEKAIAAVVKQFTQRFCQEDVGCVVEDKDGRWFFTLVCPCSWDNEWNTLEVKKLVATARACSPAMLRLLFAFLKQLVATTGIGTWYNGYMEYAEDWLEERVEDNGAYDPEEIDGDNSMVEDLHCHRHGAAAVTADSIRGAEVLSPAEIAHRLKRIRKEHPLKAAIAAGCELLKQPYDIWYFEHPSYAMEEWQAFDNGIDAVSYCDQNTVLWEYKNHMTGMWEEWLNSKYRESGSICPIAIFEVDPVKGLASREKFDMSGDWPMQLTRLFRQFDEACSEKDQSLLINILT